MQLLLLFTQIILFVCLIILFVVVALLVIYLFKRMWHKQRYKPVWTTISFVERRSNLSYDEFIQEYASVGKPVIITDVVKNWQASAKWTLDFFRSEYGSSKVSVKDCKSKTHVDMILANYIDYMRSDKPNKFLYLEEFRPLLHPKLGKDYTIPVYFPDWLQRLPKKLLGKYHLDSYLIYLGSKDTSIGLHSDILDTSNMYSAFYLIQQTFATGEVVRYSVGLVIVCFLLLMLLWLPDILKKD